MIRIKYRYTRWLRIQLFLAAVVIFLVACGQRGPLYLPEPEQEPARKTQPSSGATSDSPSETEDEGEKTSGA
jgi:predicted small lipoprotein YifL